MELLEYIVCMIIGSTIGAIIGNRLAFYLVKKDNIDRLKKEGTSDTTFTNHSV